VVTAVVADGRLEAGRPGRVLRVTAPGLTRLKSPGVAR